MSNYEKIQPLKIIIHHSANSNSKTQLPDINAYHKERGFPLSTLNFRCGYHYFIERNGEVTQTRQPNEPGYHTARQNRISIGIGLAGNFNIQTPSANQIVSMTKLIDYLLKTCQIPPTQIYPHRKFNITDCYGFRLSDTWAKDQYRNYLIENIKNTIILIRALIEKLRDYVQNKK